MIRYALTYGILAGIVVTGVLISGIVFAEQWKFVRTEWFGYLVMLVALTFIFVGVKRYRDVDHGGVIRFGRALAMGLFIALVAGVAYVLVWEIYLAATHYAFMDQYIAGIIRAKKAAGVSGVALARLVAELDAMRTAYANPLFRIPMTFMEIAPVGLIVSLVSAALLRNPRVLPATR